jgi:NAD(P) transhydrogenase subunit alpha
MTQPLTIGVALERAPGENRVALAPSQVKTLRSAGFDVAVESGAGERAWFGDHSYEEAGARLVDRPTLAARTDVLVCVGRPDADLVEGLRTGSMVLGMLRPLDDPGYVASLAAAGLDLVSLDLLPRMLSRAQPMDAITSQSNIAGYKAVLVAANAFGRFLPMLVTAAGTTRPASVLVLGAGVAGLQAIGTARRLGAVVSAYDVRPTARDEIASVGATYLDLAVSGAAGSGGYARELSEEEQATQQEALNAAIAKFDIVITTALVPGRRPPVLVTAKAVAAMAPGSIVVDMAAGPLGGNVEGSRPDQTWITGGGVTLIGAANLAATVPNAASAAYSRNATAALQHLVKDATLAIDLTDEIQAGIVVAQDGQIVQPAVSALLAVPQPATTRSSQAEGTRHE